MGLMAAATNNGSFELAPTGNHVARCYSVMDLGFQETEWQGEKKVTRKVRIAWELPNELMEDGRPFSVSATYTLSLNEKANLRKDLQSWRGRAFTEDELAGFDLFTVLGAPAMVNVVHNSANNGNTYANVGSVSPLPKGLECPAQVNESLKFSLDEYTEEAWNALPEWAQNKIARPDESSAGSPSYNEQNPPPFDDSDVPF